MRSWGASSLALLIAGVAFSLGSATASAASYRDTGCRGARVVWASDPCAGRQWGIPAVAAPEAWKTTRGSGVVVAVIDTGADFSHPDLKANLLARSGSDVIRNSAYVCPFQTRARNARSSTAVAADDEGHGTHVSGTVAAVTGNALGVAGVAPAAKVLPVKVLNSAGEGTDDRVAAGICFAANNGAKVINLSLGYDPASSIVVQGLGSDTDKAIAYAYAKGSAVIIAAGNESFPACDFPASHSKALCVGAVDRRGLKAWYSNFGTNVGVVAPGGVGSVFCHDDEDIWSTIWARSSYNCFDDGYETLAGTSMAAPHAAAAAALVKARYTAASPSFIYDKLKKGADDLGPPGMDAVYGWGRVNAARAIK